MRRYNCSGLVTNKIDAAVRRPLNINLDKKHSDLREDPKTLILVPFRLNARWTRYEDRVEGLQETFGDLPGPKAPRLMSIDESPKRTKT